jgi:N-acetylglucosamine-6-sulfatase
MTRTERALAALAVLTAAGAIALAVASANGHAQQAPRPNVVLVMTDDQTVEQMQALERVRRLIGEPGTTFERNFATYPLCCPSRATFLTGQYSHNHGVRGNRPPAGGYETLRPTEGNTLPVWMKEAGYTTAHLGKYLNGYGPGDPTHVPAGWDRWFGSTDPSTYNFFRYCINDNGRLVNYGDPLPACAGAEQRPRTYQADVYTSEAVRYIEQRAPAAEPFFLSVAYLAPHSGGPNEPGARCQGSAKPAPRHRGAFQDAPLPRPPSFNEPDVSDKPEFIRRLPRLDAAAVARITTNYRCRRESLLAVDEGVEQIVQALQRSGELDNTLVIFTADNGFFQGEHRVPGGKTKVYEPSVRVPALMRGPGVPAGRRVSALTANIDLAATIADAGGARPGRPLDGVSLRQVAQRPQAFDQRPILLENGPQDGAANPEYVALRTSRFKLVAYANGERELYDLRADPFERRNIVRQSRMRGALDAQLKRLRRCTGGSCRG